MDATSNAGGDRAKRQRREAPEHELPDAPERVLYDERPYGSWRLAECTWRRRDGVESGRFLRRWFGDGALAAASLPITLVLIDEGGRWEPKYLVAESLVVPGELGGFYATTPVPGDLVALMRGKIADVWGLKSSRYLFEARVRGQRSLEVFDEEGARRAGAQRFNDARGSKAPARAGRWG